MKIYSVAFSKGNEISIHVYVKARSENTAVKQAKQLLRDEGLNSEFEVGYISSSPYRGKVKT